MPACFQLYRKNDPSKQPIVLQVIDEEICKWLNVPIDPKKYCLNWYSTIGFSLSCGKSFADLRSDFHNGNEHNQLTPPTVEEFQWLAMLDYLDHFYVANVFHSHK